MRMGLFDRNDYQIVRNWEVIAMQGTGSDRVVMEDVFVPACRAKPYPPIGLSLPAEAYADDAMKKLQGWTDTSITHFRNLAVYGEKILLSIRYGDWSEIDDQASAKTWARSWRPEIQGYIHAYLAATGVDLSEDIVDTRGAPARYSQPSSLLEQRIVAQVASGERQGIPADRALPPRRVNFGALPGSRRTALNPARKE